MLHKEDTGTNQGDTCAKRRVRGRTRGESDTDTDTEVRQFRNALGEASTFVRKHIATGRCSQRVRTLRKDPNGKDCHTSVAHSSTACHMDENKCVRKLDLEGC